MEPRQPSAENLALSPLQPEASLQQTGEHAAASQEAGVDGHRNEQTERRLGHQVEAVAQAPLTPAPASSLPAPVVPTDDDAQAVVSDDSPMIAADEDLIEKEWVDKAKQVIASTKDDPYRREQEVKKLQIDYVKKRYGKIIGATLDD